MIMKTVRFRRRAFIAVAISLVCIIALLRTSILTSSLTDDALDTSQNQVADGVANSNNNNNNNINNKPNGQQRRRADGDDEDVVNNKDGETNVDNKDRRAYYTVKKSNGNAINDDADGGEAEKIRRGDSQVDADQRKSNDNDNKQPPDEVPPPIRGDHHQPIVPKIPPADERRSDNDNADGRNAHPIHNNVVDRHKIKPNNQNQPSNVAGNFDALNANITNGVYPIVVNGKFVPNRRIVHLDLKGAPPQVYYFEKFFAMIKTLGATGILIEYEDMFPYSGELAITRSGQAYSDKDVRQIVAWAKDYNLEVIPLVQTFGHLEWVLKHEKFAKYREVDRYAQVICLSNFDAVHLVKMAIDQVMTLHTDTSEFFHIGADEAFQIGMCERCQKTMREELSNSRDRLMVRHIANISSYVREKYGKRVLMWHDMLNNVDPQVMKEYKIGELVEPVVWAYAENLNDYLMPDMWMRFATTFPYIWGASAYKGADGPSRFYSNMPHYIRNHVSWTSQMTREYKNFREFRGLIFTGWQRFDHFAILCELLPVGVPSLAVNLLTIKYGVYDRNVLKEASKLLECSNTLEPDSPGISAFCNYAGAKVYQYVQQFKMSQQNMHTQLLDDYQLRGWLAPFNVRHNYSSAWYLDQIVDKLHMYFNDLNSLTRMLRAELSKIFFADAVDEFLYEYVQPDLDHLNELLKSAKNIGQIKTFPGRPFPIKINNVDTTTPPSQQTPPLPVDSRVKA